VNIDSLKDKIQFLRSVSMKETITDEQEANIRVEIGHLSAVRDALLTIQPLVPPAATVTVNAEWVAISPFSRSLDVFYIYFPSAFSNSPIQLIVGGFRLKIDGMPDYIAALSFARTVILVLEQAIGSVK